MSHSPIENKPEWQCRVCDAAHDYTLIAHKDENGEPEWVLQLCFRHLIWLSDKINSRIESQRD